MTNLSIYVHIPFCESKCIYCAFSSFVPNKKQVEDYFKTLWSEISQRAKGQCGKIVQTIFFGGGTPSFVESKFITKTLEMIRQNFNVSKNAEISIECNPNSATFDKLKDYKGAGFNRISFGVQSLDDNLLKFLGRRHDKLTALRAINDAKEIGFSNINADLLLGLAGQTQQSLFDEINILVNAGITHISTYMLMVEKHTPLCALKDKKKYIMSDDNSVDLYNDVVKYLADIGFLRYEISNFAKRGSECKHNQVYWTLGEYLGFGLAAHSFVDGKRIANSSCFEKYLSQKNAHRTHVVSQDEAKEEFVMLALRTREGIDLKKYQEQFGVDLLEEKKEEIVELKNFIDIKDGHLVIKPKEFGKTNLIILKLI